MSENEIWAFGLDRTFGTWKVFLRLSSKPVLDCGHEHWFGHPKLPLGTETSGHVEPGGYFLRVRETENALEITTDLLGGFRCYVVQQGETVHICDRWEPLVALLQQTACLKMDPWERTFWELHRYTMGDRTLFQGIEKIPPSSTLRIGAEGREIINRFPDLTGEPDSERHTMILLERLSRWASSLQVETAPVLLFFSGGLDSTLLALVMREHGIPFIPLFCCPVPSYPEADYDLCRARIRSKMMGLQLLELETHLDLSSAGMDRVVKDLLFDRHFGALHYAAIKAIRERWGQDALIVSGQSADSIFSYGPSELAPSNRAARMLLYQEKGLMSRLAWLAVQARYCQFLKYPRGTSERLLAFLDGDRYFPLICLSRPKGYLEYFKKRLERIVGGFHSFEAARMYLKIFGFLQGADNQVVIQSARSMGLQRVELPFTDPEIVFSTVRFKDPRLEVKVPKYPVRLLLDKLLPRWAEDISPGKINHRPLMELSSLAYGAYYKALDRLAPGVSMELGRVDAKRGS